MLLPSLSSGSEQVDDQWLDPYDMINYDSMAKTMRKPVKCDGERDGRSCWQVEDLQRQIGMLVFILLFIICAQKKSSGPRIFRFLNFIWVPIVYFLVTVISFTFTIFIKDPLRHFGQGISELLQAILKHLPVTLQFPLLIITFIVWNILYGSGQAGLQQDLTLEGKNGDHPPGPDQQHVLKHQAAHEIATNRLENSITAETMGFAEPDNSEVETEENFEGSGNPLVSPEFTVQQTANINELSQMDIEHADALAEENTSSMPLRATFKLPTSIEETRPEFMD